MRKILLLVSIFAFFFACNKQKGDRWLSVIPVGDQPSLIQELAEMTNPCNNQENYIPDLDHMDHTSYKIIKVNVHIIQNAEGKGNLEGEWGKKYIRQVLQSAKDNLKKNQKMRLPVGNNTPNIPARITYQLWPTSYIPGDDGIYFHRDEEMYYNINRGKDKNIFDRKLFEKYGIQKDTVLNIFVQDVHLDSLKSKDFDPKSNGVAFGTWIKAANWYDSVRDTVYRDGKVHLPRKYMPPKLLNHEVGHVFSLAHAWRRDNCDDTPEHSNCWNSTGRPPCEVASNNIMDYNANASALSPCQLGRMHKSMLTNKTKRALLVKDWCELNTKLTINIEDDITWNSCKTIQGNIIVKNGARLIIRCMTSMPNNSEIVVHPGGELVLQGAHLYNDCDGKWNGIKVLQEGKEAGKVVYLGANNKIEHCKHPIEFEPPVKIKS